MEAPEIGNNDSMLPLFIVPSMVPSGSSFSCLFYPTEDFAICHLQPALCALQEDISWIQEQFASRESLYLEEIAELKGPICWFLFLVDRRFLLILSSYILAGQRCVCCILWMSEWVFGSFGRLSSCRCREVILLPCQHWHRSLGRQQKKLELVVLRLPGSVLLACIIVLFLEAQENKRWAGIIPFYLYYPI